MSAEEENLLSHEQTALSFLEDFINKWEHNADCLRYSKHTCNADTP